ncbi:hypothetical protein [Hymenobacter cavernae]|uniref:Uncharacterized protein n=1 Tax=Hymenobacter cavernae TaxID=2044852 RepID=A0ABQ1TUX4_9BACT|nr:hypothetical protein [Hymenobacter cavernae]GGF04147.1 hypothetical protein GCM10011383_14030 [Hymenobacter cavernae]
MYDRQHLLEAALIAAYGSAAHPNYAFVTKALRQQPYQAIVAELRQQFSVEDITEPNYDVAFSYVVHAEREYGLQLSMVAKYFLLFPFGPNRTAEPLLETPRTEQEQRLFSVLHANSFMTLDEAILGQVTKLIGVESGQPLTFYEALFTTG